MVQISIPRTRAWMFCKVMSCRGLSQLKGSPVIDSTTSCAACERRLDLAVDERGADLLGDGSGGVAGLLAGVLGREVGAEESVVDLGPRGPRASSSGEP